MKPRKTRIALAAGVIVFLVLLPASVFSGSKVVDDMVKPAQIYICTAYGVIKNIIGPIAIFMLIVAGIIWLKSDEDAKERLKAKDLITTVLIGLIIFLIASGVVYVLTSAATGGAIPFEMATFCP